MNFAKLALVIALSAPAFGGCVTTVQSEEQTTQKFDLVRDFDDAQGMVRRETSGNVHAVLVENGTGKVLSTVDYDKQAGQVTATCAGEKGTLTTPEQSLEWHIDIARQMYDGWKRGPQPETASPAPSTTPYRMSCPNEDACSVFSDGSYRCTNDCTKIGYCNGSGIASNTCCYVHDICYLKYDCSASSWVPFVGSRACKQCNYDAVGCFGSGGQYTFYTACTGSDGSCTEADQKSVTGGELQTHSSTTTTTTTTDPGAIY